MKRSQWKSQILDKELLIKINNKQFFDYLTNPILGKAFKNLKVG